MTAPVQPYGKIPREVISQLKPLAGHLLTNIVCHINRHTNVLQISLSALADLCNMSKDSVIKYGQQLEKLKYIKIKRKPGGKHDDTNIYSLTGIVAQVALFSPVDLADTTSRLNRQQGSLKSTAGGAQTDTDYIDSLDSISEEEDTLEINDFPESDSGEYLTDGEGEDQTLEEQDSALTKLERLGITGTALEAAKLHPERIPIALKLAQSENVRNPKSYAARVLMNGAYQENDTKPAIIFPKISQTNPFDDISWSDLASDETINFDDEPDKKSSDFPPEAHLKSPITDLSPEIKDQSWDAALNQLELQLGFASFNTWLRQAQFVRIEQDGTYVIAVHNSYAKDMLQYRLYRNVRRALSDARGKQTELQFVVQADANAEPTWCRSNP